MPATESPLPEGAPARVLELSAGKLRLSLRLDLGAAIAGFWRDALPVLVTNRCSQSSRSAMSTMRSTWPTPPHTAFERWLRARP